MHVIQVVVLWMITCLTSSADGAMCAKFIVNTNSSTNSFDASRLYTETVQLNLTVVLVDSSRSSSAQFIAANNMATVSLVVLGERRAMVNTTPCSFQVNVSYRYTMSQRYIASFSSRRLQNVQGSIYASPACRSYS